MWRGDVGRASLLATLGSVLIFFGWRRWTHAIIDFGRELYVPWRLAEGEVLYRDLAYFNGPLSPYFNSLVFRLFGVGYSNLFLFNILLLVCITWLLYRLLQRLADPLTATVGCALFLTIFALADLNGFGNYNFVTPYSHEMTHATLLSLLILLVLGDYLRQPTRWRVAVLGLLLGLIFLTKAEFFLAGSCAVGTALILEPSWRSLDGRGVRDRLAALAGGLALPPLVAFLCLLAAMPVAEAWRGTLGPWPYMFLDELTDLVFYRKGLGTDAPGEHLGKMLTWAAIYLLIFAPPLAISRFSRPESRHRKWVALFVVLWVTAITVLVAPRFDFTNLPRPLPLLLLGAIALALPGHLRRDPAARPDSKGLTLLAYAIFALVLLAKMPLHPRFQNYGFALVLPATMVMVIYLVHRIPKYLDSRGGSGLPFRLSATVFLALVGLAFFWPSVLVYREKQLPYGHGRDMYRVQERYVVIQRLLDELPSLVGPEETMLVMPEGIMLNFQTRRLNPTRHINFMPPELIMFGEGEIITELEQNPPDVVVLIKRQTIEYGFETIGVGYGEELMQWIGPRYAPVDAIEDPALFGRNFGKALILRPQGQKTNAPPKGGASVQ